MVQASVVKDGKATNEGSSSSWLRFHSRVNDAIDDFYHRLGYWVATHTKATLAISLAMVLFCCAGFLNFTLETYWEDLWVPADSLSKQQEDIVLSYFDDESDFALMLLESPSGRDGNLLTKDAFDKLWRIHGKVLALETEAGSTFADICSKNLDGVTCQQPVRGVTRFWGSDFSVYKDVVRDDEDVLASINVERFPDGQPVNIDVLFGNSVRFGSDGKIVEAAILSQDYSLITASEGEAREEALGWMVKFTELLEEEAEMNSDTFNVVYRTGRTIDDGLADSVSGEIVLFAATYITMIIFVTITIGRCREGSVRRRSWLALAGICLVVAAGVAAYGANSAFGIPFTSLSQILPFILVGIGVDDMFVIVASFDQTDPSLPVEERVALALMRCGVSITYTSLTNFFAFALGSLSLLPAVEYFCYYAAAAILFDFVLQMTAFVAFVTMDANRQKTGRMDWCCCFIDQASIDEEKMPRGVALAETGTGDAPSVTVAVDGGARELSKFGRWLKDSYASFILAMPGKILALLATGGLLAAGIYGAKQASSGFDLLDLMPDDHYGREYMELGREYEIAISNQYIPLHTYTREVDYPDTKVQAQIQAMDIQMEDQEFVVGPVDSWLTSFILWANESTEYSDKVGTFGNYSVYDDQDTFYEALATFTKDGENARFLSNIVYTDNSTIEISRTGMYLVDQMTTSNYVDALEDARHVVEESCLYPEPFAFSTVFIFSEQFLVIYEELLMSFVLALVAVAFLSVFALGQISIVFLVCFTVVIVDVDLLGFVYHWGLEINSVTVIELIMAVGLVVDYMVHIVHYFLHQDPTADKDERIAAALGEIGPSVMVGAATTFLGIMPMAFASSYIFEAFFKMFLVIIAFGLFHGMVFIPVAMSLIPDRYIRTYVAPAASKEATASRQQQ